ncbi:MAG TPA: rhombosortase [Burkholderiaceae bacterium]|nr:rhombosortase [Burkholderiaceae bacterium]
MARGLRLKPGQAWLVLCALLAAGAAAAALLPAAALEWRPELALAEPWRWWTAALVHWTPRHLAANLAGAAVLAGFGWTARAPTGIAVAWAAAWPLTQLALLAQPALQRYGGLSGVLHAGVAAVAWWLLRRDRGARRLVGGAVLAGLVLKLVLERPWAAVAVVVPEWDFPVAPFAHASGALAGLLAAVVADAWPRRAAPLPP